MTTITEAPVLGLSARLARQWVDRLNDTATTLAARADELTAVATAIENKIGDQTALVTPADMAAWVATLRRTVVGNNVAVLVSRELGRLVAQAVAS